MFIVVAIIFTVIGWSLGVRFCTKKFEKYLEEMKQELEEALEEITEDDVDG